MSRGSKSIIMCWQIVMNFQTQRMVLKDFELFSLAGQMYLRFVFTRWVEGFFLLGFLFSLFVCGLGVFGLLC